MHRSEKPYTSMKGNGKADMLGLCTVAAILIHSAQMSSAEAPNKWSIISGELRLATTCSAFEENVVVAPSARNIAV